MLDLFNLEGQLDTSLRYLRCVHSRVWSSLPVDWEMHRKEKHDIFQNIFSNHISFYGKRIYLDNYDIVTIS